MEHKAAFDTTIIGSFPHDEPRALCERLARAVDIPAWPQLPRRTFVENMYAQYAGALPNIELDHAREKVFFRVDDTLLDAVEAFYGHYLTDDVAPFALTEDTAAGLAAMLDTLTRVPGSRIKGQVTGPVSFGLTVTDQDGRASLYHDLLVDVIVKNTVMHARWQVQQLKAVRPHVLLFVDEPYMAAFGSAYVSLERAQVVGMLDEVFEAIHEEGAQAGVHCCGNTDWSVLLATSVDVLSLDAFGYLDTLSLYPGELRAFLDRGGIIAWGIVPSSDQAWTESGESLAARLRRGFDLLAERAGRQGIALTPGELAAQSLITPSCGLGTTDPPLADHALALLQATAACLREA